MRLQYFTIRINVGGTAPLDGSTLFTGTPATGVVQPGTGIVEYTVAGPVGVFDLASIVGVFTVPLVLQGISVENAVNPHLEGSRVSIQSPATVDNPATRNSALAFFIGDTNGVLPQTNFVVPVGHRISIDTTPDGVAPGPHVIQFSLARATDELLNTLLVSDESSIDPPEQWVDPVRLASVAGENISTLAPGDTIDAVVVASGDSVLLKNQVAGEENGIYTIQDAAPAVRREDFSSDVEVRSGLSVAVSEGTANGTTAWVLATPNPIFLDVTVLVFAQIGGGGAAFTWAQTLVAGNVSGARDPTITTGQTIVGQTDLDLLSAADTTIQAGTPGSGSGELNLFAADHVNVTPGDAVAASGNDGSRFLASTGAGDLAGDGGTMGLVSGPGGATGAGGAWLGKGGEGGPTSGPGGPALLEGGDAAAGVSAGGDLTIRPGRPTGGAARGLLTLLNEGPDTDQIVVLSTTGTNAAASKIFGGNRDPNGVVTGKGGDYYLRSSGATSALYIHKEAAPSTVWTIFPTGTSSLAAIDVARTTSLAVPGTPGGLAFNSEQGGGFDAAVWTWSSGDDDIEVDNDGQYLIHGEMSIDSTSAFEASYVLDWFLNGVAFADAAHEHGTTHDDFEVVPCNINSTVIRTLSAGDEVGFRVDRDDGSGGEVIPNTARLNIVRLS